MNYSSAFQLLLMRMVGRIHLIYTVQGNFLNFNQIRNFFHANQIYPVVMVPYAVSFFTSARKPFKHIFPLRCEEIEKLYHKTVKTASKT